MAESDGNNNLIDKEQEFTSQIYFNAMNQVIKEFGEFEANVLKARFGMDNGESKDIRTVAKMFKISTEKVRTIEAKALRRLRALIR